MRKRLFGTAVAAVVAAFVVAA
ncbi:MAG: hypothetical protein QOF83_3130, partial [Solirubrobacteraceae bacterium]|nr:hypothetical protein [Solirubrobacteraceae bacterium]